MLKHIAPQDGKITAMICLAMIACVCIWKLPEHMDIVYGAVTGIGSMAGFVTPGKNTK